MGIQSIQLEDGEGSTSPEDLLQDPMLAFIDAGVSHIWLPLEVCHAFERAFGIVWDPTTGLYPVNDTTHDALFDRNANITFVLGSDVTSTSTTTITLPYKASDLELTAEYPGVSQSTRYFPLRRATNSSQITLGRAFLQHAYIIADYERSVFSVNPVIFSNNMEQDLRPILPSSASTSTPSPSDTAAPPTNNLSTGAIAGIIAAAIFASSIILLGFLVLIRQRRRRKPRQPSPLEDLNEKSELPAPDAALSGLHTIELSENEAPHPELPAPLTGAFKPELEGESASTELGDGVMRQGTLHHQSLVYELAGTPLQGGYSRGSK